MLNESGRQKREEAMKHHKIAFKLQLQKMKHASEADKLDLERHYLEKTTISNHDHKIRAAEEAVRAKRQEIFKVVQEADSQLVAELRELEKRSLRPEKSGAVRAKRQEIDKVVLEAGRPRLLAELQELERVAEQKWEQRNQYKKQVKEKEVKIARLRRVQFDSSSRAKALTKMVWKLVREAEDAEARAKKILVDDQEALEELPHTLD